MRRSVCEGDRRAEQEDRVAAVDIDGRREASLAADGDGRHQPHQ